MGRKLTYEELEQQVKELEEEAIERKRVEEELTKHQEHLEKLVEERTAKLSKANKQLKREIEERKQAEKALKTQVRILDSMVEGVNVSDENAIIIFTNPAFDRIFGYKRSELIGKHVSILNSYLPEENARIIGEIIERLKTERAWSGESNNIKKDGTTFTTYARVSALEISGKQHWVSVQEDITERKQAEEEKRELEAQFQQAQKMEAIGTLAGGIAHDFNNLLMGIQGNTSLMFKDIDSSHPHYERLKSIEKQIQNSIKLTSRLLGYARKGRYEVISLSLNQTVNETANTFSQTKKEIVIHKKLAEDLYAIEADQGQIEQVLLNLFINAADAMPRGGDLYLETKNVSKKDLKNKPYKPTADKYVLLIVKDTGIGMDKSTIEHIFEPFFTTKEMGRGTGLGLASVYGIIKAHGGYIDVKSKKKHGTTFLVYLPATKRKVKKAAKTSDKLIKGTGTVLLVDDEEIIQDVCKDMLKTIGYKIFSAKDGKEAIEIYRKNQNDIDMVLLDMIMPNISGGEVYDRLKEINPDIKVLLSSGYTIDGEATEILNRGCDGFIQKPFNINDLSQKIREVLKKK